MMLTFFRFSRSLQFVWWLGAGDINRVGGEWWDMFLCVRLKETIWSMILHWSRWRRRTLSLKSVTRFWIFKISCSMIFLMSFPSELLSQSEIYFDKRPNLHQHSAETINMNVWEHRWFGRTLIPNQMIRLGAESDINWIIKQNDYYEHGSQYSDKKIDVRNNNIESDLSVVIQCFEPKSTRPCVDPFSPKHRLWSTQSQ